MLCETHFKYLVCIFLCLKNTIHSEFLHPTTYQYLSMYTRHSR